MVFILAVDNLALYSFSQICRNGRVQKSNAAAFCLDIRYFQAPTLFAEIHGTIINQHKSRRGHYKTCIGMKYEETKTFLNSD